MPGVPDAVALSAGLLVGGASRRFGSAKALAPLAGRPLASRVAATLRTVSPDLVLLGEGQVPPDLGALPRLADVPGVGGPLAGILAALRLRPPRAWLVAACDQALATPEACAWLLGARGPGVVAVLPRRGAGGIEPLLALYEPAALPLLEALAASGRSSLQPLAGASGVVTPRVPPDLLEAWTSFDRAVEVAAAEAGGER